MTTTTGYIAMADISGYTAFVAATELEHSREILSELLDVTSGALQSHLRPVRLQGDAIICVGQDDDVVSCLESAFVAFHKRVRAMVAATTCPCAACQTVPSLTLKFVAAHGTYSNVNVRGTQDLVGADVNIAFRLLKNHVPSHEYVLITRAVLERMASSARERFVPIAEEYDVGRVEAFYRDLHDLRDLARRPARGPVRDDEAHLRFRHVIDASPERVFATFRDPKAFGRLMSAPNVTLEGGARGTMNGAAYHCHHGNGKQTIFEIVGLREPDEMTLSLYGNGPEAHGTFTLMPLDDGRATDVRFHLRFADEVRGITLLIARTVWGFFIAKGFRALPRLVADAR